MMKGKNMSQAVVTLKKGEGRTLKAGGMWVYDNEIDSIMGSATLIISLLTGMTPILFSTFFLSVLLIYFLKT